MMRVWIAQCLCPDRHCICAMAGEAENRDDAEKEIETALRGHMAVFVKAGHINPWCGLCKAGSETWTYELGRTRYRTMQEAKPRLKQMEAEQAAVRAVFGDMKRSD